MKKITIGLVLAALLVAIIATAAFADDDTPLTPKSWGGRGLGGWAGRGMMGGPGYGTGLMHEYMHEYLAEALGISEDELDSRREAGEMMHDIAASLGLSQEEFFTAMDQARTKAMEQAYGDGLLSQEQYEFFLDRGAGMGQYGGGMGHHGGGWGGRGSGGFYGDCPYDDFDS